MSIESRGFEIGIVSGGTFEKIAEQLGKVIDVTTHFFTECGCKYYKRKDDNEIFHIYTKNLREHEMWLPINALIKRALCFLSMVSYPVTGHFINLRSGIVYI